MAARRRSTGVLRLALAFAILMAALSVVVWRQSRALEAVRALEKTRDERAVVEAARTELEARIQRLESRGRVVAEAERRLGMHVPTGEEIVILPAPRRAEGAER
ncbi:MAG TPA: cell division protein FtsL [Gemmatimonadales bacterium]